MTRLGKRRRLLVVVAALCAAIGSVAGYAYAVTQTANQDFTGCLQNGKIAFVAIGGSPLMPCSPQATQITWSQTGPQGLPGPPGTPGTNGTNGTNGTSVTSTALSSGDPNCPNGGSQFTAALNNVTYACNGAQGPTGATGPSGSDPTADAFVGKFGTNTNTASSASGAECTIGQILLSAGPLAVGLPANGQLLQISQHTALFDLIGTTFGGDGVTTFGVPDLGGVAPNGLTYSICDIGFFPAGR